MLTTCWSFCHLKSLYEGDYQVNMWTSTADEISDMDAETDFLS